MPSLQIWKNGLHPMYHHEPFSEKERRRGFVMIRSALKDEKGVPKKQETKAERVMKGTIRIHIDSYFGASLSAPDRKYV